MKLPEIPGRIIAQIARAPLRKMNQRASGVCVGDKVHKCTGPRIHVARTGQIENFRLMHHLIYDRFKRRYLLVGCVGEGAEEIIEKLDIQRQRPGWH